MDIEQETQELMKILVEIHNEDPGLFELEFDGFSPDWTAPRVENAIREFLTRTFSKGKEPMRIIELLIGTSIVLIVLFLTGWLLGWPW